MIIWKRGIKRFWALDPNPNYISVVNGLWQVQRGPFFVKVKSVATDGTQLKTQVVKSTYADGACISIYS